MQTELLIPIKDFCRSHEIDIAFISLLEETGMIEMTTIQESFYIEADQLHQLEKIIRFYYEMDINLEGIETISHLLQRIQGMQEEIVLLKNRLRLYETE